jgi:hypothetical protein
VVCPERRRAVGRRPPQLGDGPVQRAERGVPAREVGADAHGQAVERSDGPFGVGQRPRQHRHRTGGVAGVGPGHRQAGARDQRVGVGRAQDAGALRGDAREGAQGLGQAVRPVVGRGERVPGDQGLRVVGAEHLLAGLDVAGDEVEPLLGALGAGVGHREVPLDHQGVRVARAEHGAAVVDEALQQLRRLREPARPPVGRAHRVRRLERAA